MLTVAARRRLANRYLNPFQPPTTFPADRDSLRGLKWIGPYFRQRFRDREIYSWNDLEEELERNNKHENGALLRDILSNARSLQCIYSDRGYRDFAINRVYKVREVNWFAYNSVLYYARHEFSDEAVSRLPRPLKPQKARVGFPTSCPNHH